MRMDPQCLNRRVRNHSIIDLYSPTNSLCHQPSDHGNPGSGSRSPARRVEVSQGASLLPKSESDDPANPKKTVGGIDAHGVRPIGGPSVRSFDAYPCKNTNIETRSHYPGSSCVIRPYTATAAVLRVTMNGRKNRKKAGEWFMLLLGVPSKPGLAQSAETTGH